jgi:hypothetical protein
MVKKYHLKTFLFYINVIGWHMCFLFFWIQDGDLYILGRDIYACVSYHMNINMGI